MEYARHINAYVACGLTEGFEGLEDPAEMEPLDAHLPTWLAALRQANAEGSVDAFRAQWPPSARALEPLLEANAQGFTALAWLPDGRLLARVGAYYEEGQHTVSISADGNQVQPLPDLDLFGHSPDGRWWAFLRQGTISVHDGHDGPEVARFALPTGAEDAPEGIAIETSADDPLTPIQLTPYAEGQRLLLVHSQGVCVLGAQGPRRLLPTDEALRSSAQYARQQGRPALPDGRQPVSPAASMMHAAISPDGRWLAAGEQDSAHLIFNADTLALHCQIEPYSSYPHHAAFFADSQHLVLNACHFYNGSTMAVPVQALAAQAPDTADGQAPWPELDGSSRVYASAPLGEGTLILGNAYGYLFAYTPQQELWRLFVGRTIAALAVSPDGKRLAVGSHSGTLHLFALDAGRPDWQIGTADHCEYRRWLFWRTEEKPLAW